MNPLKISFLALSFLVSQAIFSQYEKGNVTINLNQLGFGKKYFSSEIGSSIFLQNNLSLDFSAGVNLFSNNKSIFSSVGNTYYFGKKNTRFRPFVGLSFGYNKSIGNSNLFGEPSNYYFIDSKIGLDFVVSKRVTVGASFLMRNEFTNDKSGLINSSNSFFSKGTLKFLISKPKEKLKMIKY